MQIQILSVSQKNPSWLNEGFQTYIKRLPKELSIHLKEIPTPSRANYPLAKCQELEAKQLIAAIPEHSHVILLDERGSLWDSMQLANQLQQWQLQAKPVSLLIGGPDGFHSSIYALTKEMWSLSKLTLPHLLIRVILAEQFYRAWTILNKHPYHRP